MSRFSQGTTKRSYLFSAPPEGLTILTELGPGGRLKWAVATLDPATLTTTKRRRRHRIGGAR